MKVYLLWRYEPWEDKVLKGIFDTREKAEALMDELKFFDRREGDEAYYSYGINEEEVR